MPTKKQTKSPISHVLFAKHLKELGFLYEREQRFHGTRKWRWDFVLTEHRVAIEICGQIWRKGGHSTGAGIQRDYDKANHGTMCGYRVLHFSTNDVMTGRAKAFLEFYMGGYTK